MRNSFTQSRKFKYGSVATAFTIAFVAIVVIFNIIFTALAQKYNWYIDMTEKQVYTLSDEAKELLADIPDEVNIYFASDPDVLMNGSNSSYTRMIYTTALQIEEAFPNIHVECENVYKNPGFFREFYNTAATDIDSDSVVITSGSEVRVYKAQAFFTFNDPTDASTVWAYSGEKSMISGIMQVTQTEKPKVAFTIEHGEEMGNALALANVFAANGFEVQTVNLAKDTLDDDTRILVIYNPIYDFIGAEAEDASTNEIEKIDAFLDRRGCLMVFADPQYADNLTNLNEFLAEWGIKSILNGGAQMTKDIVKSVVDKADPIGLLGMCCPADEYDSEIEIIFARIRKGMSADEIAKVIHAVFFEMFSESIDTKLCDTMACEMLSLDC